MINELNIAIPASRQALVFSAEALGAFANARQLSASAKETGGLLFAKIDQQEIRVMEVSRASRKDSISRYLFAPSLRAKRKSIKQAFERGLHFIGEWHTHPEQDPTPSTLDNVSMGDSFEKSKHELERFVMVIVGDRKEELSLCITLHSSGNSLSLGHFCVPIMPENSQVI